MSRVIKTLRTPNELADAGLVARNGMDLARVAERYAVAITPAMVDLIDRNDADDPIARQFVPDVRELEQRPEERADPIGDIEHEAGAGRRASLSRSRAAEADARVSGVLPVLLPARDGGAGWRGADGRGVGHGHRLHRAQRSHVRSHHDGRRSADAGAAPHSRDHAAAFGDRACARAALALSRAGGRSGAGDAGAC